MKNIKNLEKGSRVGKGSSSGISGLEVSKHPCNCGSGPITSRAKAFK